MTDNERDISMHGPARYEVSLIPFATFSLSAAFFSVRSVIKSILLVVYS